MFLQDTKYNLDITKVPQKPLEELVVLVVEDCEAIQQAIRGALGLKTRHVLKAANGLAALKILKESEVRIDLIMLDLDMPELDGIKTISHIRASENPDIANVPVIAATGNAQDLTEESLFKLGFNGFCQKPINYQVVYWLLEKWFTESL
jgi:CheY-like chemotaxis protein